jgi:hypothetical protein
MNKTQPTSTIRLTLKGQAAPEPEHDIDPQIMRVRRKLRDDYRTHDFVFTGGKVAAPKPAPKASAPIRHNPVPIAAQGSLRAPGSTRAKAMQIFADASVRLGIFNREQARRAYASLVQRSI